MAHVYSAAANIYSLLFSTIIGALSGLVFFFICGEGQANKNKKNIHKSLLFITLMLIASIIFEYNYFNIERQGVLHQRLEAMNVNKYQYLKEIYDESWDEVCVLSPYTRNVSSDSDNREFYHKKIRQHHLDTSRDNLWYLLFKRDEEFFSVSFEGRLSFKQHGFDESIQESFKASGFKPKDCVDFENAVFFRFIESYNSIHNNLKLNFENISLGEYNNGKK